MTIEQQIDQSIAKGVQIAYAWADKFITQASQGEDLGCCEMKLLLLNQWITILEDYKFENFGDNGNITPSFNCITISNVNSIMAKISKLEC